MVSRDPELTAVIWFIGFLNVIVGILMLLGIILFERYGDDPQVPK
jgi:hypothetical protein